MDAIRDLYGNNKEISSSIAGKTVFRAYADDGYVDIINYDLFPGISLQFNDVHGNPNWTWHTNSSLLEINYCRSGRYECEFGQGSCVRVREDDFAANPMCRQKTESKFPLGYYQGISLTLDIEVAHDYMRENRPEFHVRIDDLIERLCPRACFVVQTDGVLKMLFRQMYETPLGDEITFYRIKTLELLALLSNWHPRCEQCAAYMRRNRIRMMRLIAEELRLDIRGERNISEIAEQHGICLTQLTRDFSKVYGMTPGAYRKRFRMETAAKMLLRSEERIIDIAAEVGYENASKFAAAFRTEMGITPVEHRKKYTILDSLR